MDLLFYIAFLGQVLLISAVVPHVVGRRLRRILDLFPVSTHPQLYPRPVSSYRTGLAIFTWSNHLLLLAGLALVAILYLLHGTETPVPRTWPGFFGAVQFVPMLTMDLSCFELFLRLRELHPMKQRSTARHLAACPASYRRGCSRWRWPCWR